MKNKSIIFVVIFFLAFTHCQYTRIARNLNQAGTNIKFRVRSITVPRGDTSGSYVEKIDATRYWEYKPSAENERLVYLTLSVYNLTNDPIQFNYNELKLEAGELSRSVAKVIKDEQSYFIINKKRAFTKIYLFAFPKNIDPEVLKYPGIEVIIPEKNPI